MTDGPAHGERRVDNQALHDLMERLGEQSGDLSHISEAYEQFVAATDTRYEQFTRRVLRGLTILAFFVVLSLAALGFGLSRQNTLANEQVEGRRLAINALCGAISGVADAGRDVIQGGGRTEAQKAQAGILAATYVRKIGESVAAVAGARGLVAKDGTLDCTKLRNRAGAGKQ